MNIILFQTGTRRFEEKDERTQHIRKVLKLKVGDSFFGGEENGMEGRCTITGMEDGVDFAFTQERDGSSLHPLTLIVAQVRPICMKRILREAASLGVRRLVLPVSDLGEKSYLGATLYTEGEYLSILRDGAMQGGHTGVTECILCSGVKEAIRLAGEGERFLLDNVIGAKALSSLDLSGKDVVLAIGPERGWSERERKVFMESGYAPCLLGSRILRTETAVPTGTAIALSRMGLM